eukprot:3259472-Prymnesium_polylepis.2
MYDKSSASGSGRVRIQADASRRTAERAADVQPDDAAVVRLRGDATREHASKQLLEMLVAQLCIVCKQPKPGNSPALAACCRTWGPKRQRTKCCLFFGSAS